MCGEEQKYPWLLEEIKAIKEAISVLKMPFMGICLGHQLLAYAFGAKVSPSLENEVGVMSVKKTLHGKQSPFESLYYLLVDSD